LDLLARNYFGFKGIYDYQKDLFWSLETNNFSIVNKSRQMGISWFFAGYCLLKAIRGKTSLIMSASDRQSKRVMMYVDQWYEAFDSHFSGLKERTIQYNKSEIRIKCKNNIIGEIVSLPNSASSSRGMKADMIFFDEYAHFLYGSDNKVWEALLPSLSRNRNMTVCINSTPFGELNTYYDMYHNNKNNYPNFVKKFYHYSECPDIDVGMIKLNLDSLSFAQEYEGQFIGDLDTYFPFSLIHSVVNPDLEYYTDLTQIKTKIFWGIDVGRRRDFTAIIGLAEIEGTLKVVYKQVLKSEQEKQYENQYNIMASLLRVKNSHKAYIDSLGIGNQLSEGLTDEFGLKVFPFVFTNENKNIMFPDFRRCLETQGITIPDDPELINCLHLIERQSVGNVIRYDSSKQRDEYGHADIAIALVLAYHCYKNEGYEQNIVSFEGLNPPRHFSNYRNRHSKRLYG